MSEETTTPPTRARGGNPSKYRPEFVAVARGMCRMGATDWDLANEFEVDRWTIQVWRTKHPEFEKATRVSKGIADHRVKRSLFERATGYTYESEKIITVPIGDGLSEVQRIPITVHVPPDVPAALKWLFNRMPDEFRDHSSTQEDQNNVGGVQEVKVVIEGGLPADEPEARDEPQAKEA